MSLENVILKTSICEHTMIPFTDLFKPRILPIQRSAVNFELFIVLSSISILTFTVNQRVELSLIVDHRWVALFLETVYNNPLPF